MVHLEEVVKDPGNDASPRVILNGNLVIVPVAALHGVGLASASLPITKVKKIKIKKTRHTKEVEELERKGKNQLMLAYAKMVQL